MSHPRSIAGYYRRPSRFRVRIFDPLARALIGRLRLGGESFRILVVRDPGTGRRHRRPVVISTVDNQRYIISTWGDSPWARRLRAGADSWLSGGRRDVPFRAVELEGPEKKAFVRRFAALQPSMIKRYLEADPKTANDKDLDAVAEKFPVFLVDQSVPGARLARLGLRAPGRDPVGRRLHRIGRRRSALDACQPDAGVRLRGRAHDRRARDDGDRPSTLRARATPTRLNSANPSLGAPLTPDATSGSADAPSTMSHG